MLRRRHLSSLALTTFYFRLESFSFSYLFNPIISSSFLLLSYLFFSSLFPILFYSLPVSPILSISFFSDYEPYPISLMSHSYHAPLICQVCYELYDTEIRLPMILTCGHSLCHCCLRKLTSTSLHTSRCPFCNDIFLAQATFPKNFAILDLLEHQHISSSCGRCKIHDKELSMYCLTDHVPVCVVCQFGEHRNHSLHLLDSKAREKRERLLAIQEKVRREKGTLDELEDLLQQYKDRLAEATSAISTLQHQTDSSILSSDNDASLSSSLHPIGLLRSSIQRTASMLFMSTDALSDEQDAETERVVGTFSAVSLRASSYHGEEEGGVRVGEGVGEGEGKGSAFECDDVASWDATGRSLSPFHPSSRQMTWLRGHASSRESW